MGGGPGGDVASSVLVHRLVAGIRGPLGIDQLATALRVANWDLRARVELDPSLEGMATTFTGIFMSPAGMLLLAHTGDSRAYLLRDGALTRQTRDDSFVQLLVESGILGAADASHHPQRNIITASLRGGEEDRITMGEREARVGDRWLLCSDGVTDYLPDSDLLDLLTPAAGRPAAGAGLIAEAIVERALTAGSTDNVTAIVCDVVGDAVWDSVPVFDGSAVVRFQERFDDRETA